MINGMFNEYINSYLSIEVLLLRLQIQKLLKHNCFVSVWFDSYSANERRNAVEDNNSEDIDKVLPETPSSEAIEIISISSGVSNFDTCMISTSFIPRKFHINCFCFFYSIEFTEL